MNLSSNATLKKWRTLSLPIPWSPLLLSPAFSKFENACGTGVSPSHSILVLVYLLKPTHT